ncbi:iron complex transport system ATP-binding protein [Microbacterium endophyticum]|uniref:Iron complex transport system ATP-binding protein n=1 Tax=Microbacterium endophyticum TaxID=1526412 RepID=A0A7W4YLL0_9MICO|nr:ABC transporter ATP-binding protein [Microbacterium endophyticum]MBB2975550.1 iron complex transport system ATP-binding protein [Microbacterium endophyticum]NIK35431.1 iron complex transport system ATP-binding protein [Microbacterium endophyticum]
MITAGGVAVRFGRREVLSGIDLAVCPGTVTGIVGPNGSGKSTLLRAMLGAVPVSAGRVLLDGRDLRRVPRRSIAQRVAFVGQNVGGDPALRVADEVALAGIARGRGGASFDLDVAQALDAVGLGDRAQSALGTLSGGERQRVSIARAIAQNAEIVLLDEPTNHLDVRHRLELAAMLRDIAPTVVIVLHDLDLAAHVCDHVVVLNEGRVAAAGSADEVLVPAVLDEVYGVEVVTTQGEGGVRSLTFRLPADVVDEFMGKKEL